MSRKRLLINILILLSLLCLEAILAYLLSKTQNNQGAATSLITGVLFS